MTLSELKGILARIEESGIPDSAIVVLSKDVEGNGYSPLSNYWVGNYVPSTTYSGEAYLHELTDEDKEAGYTDEDLYEGEDAQLALFLTPTN